MGYFSQMLALVAAHSKIASLNYLRNTHMGLNGKVINFDEKGWMLLN